MNSPTLNLALKLGGTNGSLGITSYGAIRMSTSDFILNNKPSSDVLRKVRTIIQNAANSSSPQANLNMNLVASIAGQVTNQDLVTLTPLMAENFIKAGFSKIGEVQVKAGNQVSMKDFIADCAQGTGCAVNIGNSLIGNDSYMVKAAAESRKLFGPDQVDEPGLMISSTGFNANFQKDTNLEAGHAGAVKAYKAATKSKYPEVYKIIDGCIRFSSEDRTPSLITGRARKFANAIEYLFSGGASDAKLNSQFLKVNKLNPNRHRGLVADAAQVIEQFMDGEDKKSQKDLLKDKKNQKELLKEFGLTEKQVFRGKIANRYFSLDLQPNNRPADETWGISNKFITKLANEEKDPFAQALVKYTAKRMAETFYGLAIMAQQTPPKNVILQGSYIQNVLKSPEAQEVFKNKYSQLSKIPVEQVKIEFFNPEHDGVADVMNSLIK